MCDFNAQVFLRVVISKWKPSMKIRFDFKDQWVNYVHREMNTHIPKHLQGIVWNIAKLKTDTISYPLFVYAIW